MPSDNNIFPFYINSIIINITYIMNSVIIFIIIWLISKELFIGYLHKRQYNIMRIFLPPFFESYISILLFIIFFHQLFTSLCTIKIILII